MRFPKEKKLTFRIFSLTSIALSMALFSTGCGNIVAGKSFAPGITTVTDTSAASAIFAGGTGTAADPFMVMTPAHMAMMRSSIYMGMNFKLGGNIDMAGEDGSSPEKIAMPIGFYSIGQATGTPYTGVFDGDGHTIKNLRIANGGSGNATGLFAYTRGATISNLTLDQVSITGDGSTGALIGFAVNTTVSNVHITGTVTSPDNSTYQTGGMIGTLSSVEADSHSSITNCQSSANVIGHDSVAGLIGAVLADQGGAITLSNLAVTGTVADAPNTLGNTFGGLIAYLRANNGSTVSVTNGFSTASVHTNGAFGGGAIGTILANSGSHITIGQVYETGAFTTTASWGWFNGILSGGFAGVITASDAGSTIAITNSYASGAVTNEGTDGQSSQAIGGFAGIFRGTAGGTATLSRSYATGAVNVAAPGSSAIGGFIGQLDGNGGSAVVNDTYATGAVTAAAGSSSVGGYAGSVSVAQINRAYATGIVTGPNSAAFVGSSAGTYVGCFWDSSTAARGVVGGASAGIVGVTTAQLMMQATFPYNFAQIWSIAEGVTPPTLK